jgi:hypothetical protein
VNPQEIFIDVSSGRFLDGNSATPIANPKIFGNEERTFKINVLEIKRNVVSQKNPSAKSGFQARLGTPLLKLSDGQEVPTAPVETIRALASVATLPAQQAVATSSLYTYTPVTASIIASIVTIPVVTGVFRLNVDYVAPVTATISANYATSTASTITLGLNFSDSGIGDAYAIQGLASPLDITRTLNNPVTALFSATVLGGTIVKIDITNKGAGYPNGTYDLNFGGAATASVTASATVVASNGFVQSVSIINAGTSYSGTPAVTLFGPSRGLVSSGGIIDLGVKGLNQNQVSLIFPDPDAPLTPPSSVRAEGTIAYTGQGTNWNVNITNKGYGYSSIAAISHSDILAFLPQASVITANFTNVGYGLINKQYEGGGIVSLINNVVTHSFSDVPTKISIGGLAPQRGLISPLLVWITDSEQVAADHLFGISRAGNYTKSSPSPTSDVAYLRPIASSAFREIASLLNSQGIVVTGSIHGPANHVFKPGSRGGLPSGGAITQEAFNEYLDRGTVGVVTAQILAGRDNTFAVGSKYLQNIPPEGRSCKVAILPKDDSFVPIRYAVAEFSVPSKDFSYAVNVALPLSSNSSRGSELGWAYRRWEFGGGKYTPSVKMLDMGEGYPASYRGGYKIVELGSVSFQGSLVETSLPLSYSVPNSASAGFLKTAFSEEATVSTAPGRFSTQYILASGGIGYTKNTTIALTTVLTTGYVKSATISNNPQSYLRGEFDCLVESPPSGTAAKIKLLVDNNSFSLAVIDGGSGYTSAPVVTAPAPNFKSGQIKSVSVLTRPDGYTKNVFFPLTVPTSSEESGSGQVLFSIQDNGQINFNIANEGFGYTDNLVATAPDPDKRLSSGFIGTLELQNSPEGYIVGQSYDLLIQNSPQQGGNALGRMIKSASGISFEIINQGAGYTSPPIVTAPAPDAPNGLLAGLQISSSGRGFAPGVYEATVTTAPAGGETAKANFVVTNDGDSRFNIISSGKGYSSAPSVSVATPAGNVISSITITCQGSFYSRTNAVPVIQDAIGQGAVLAPPSIINGGVNSLNVLNGGYGFSNNPKVIFNKPPLPESEVLQPNQILRDFNITTASANAILTTANQRDVLFEVYETDGTKEQVVVQGTMSLAKRVLE